MVIIVRVLSLQGTSLEHQPLASKSPSPPSTSSILRHNAWRGRARVGRAKEGQGSVKAEGWKGVSEASSSSFPSPTRILRNSVWIGCARVNVAWQGAGSCRCRVRRGRRIQEEGREGSQPTRQSAQQHPSLPNLLNHDARVDDAG